MKRDYITPRQLEAAKKHTWVVRYLRGVAVAEFIGAAVAVILTTSPAIQVFLLQEMNMAVDTASLVALPISTLLGILAGLAACVLTWGLAMVIDDLHATRMYLEGFILYEDEEARPRS